MIKLRGEICGDQDQVFGRDAQTLVLVFSEPVQKAHGIVSLVDADGNAVNGRWSKMEDLNCPKGNCVGTNGGIFV